jgi:hypothetical protein
MSINPQAPVAGRESSPLGKTSPRPAASPDRPEGLDGGEFYRSWAYPPTRQPPAPATVAPGSGSSGTARRSAANPGNCGDLFRSWAYPARRDKGAE